VHGADLNQLLPLAFACFLLATVETSAIGRTFALKHGYRFDPNQELLGIAGANVLAGLGHAYPVSGGMTQSLVNESGGARTPVSGLVAALIVLVSVLFLSGALHDLPQPVLAAIVLTAVTSLFKPAAIAQLWRADRVEFAVAVAALFGVLGSGLLRGVLIGSVLSLVLLLRRASKPHVAFLGRIPGTDRYSDLERHPDNEPVPGALLFRTESSLLYFNADHVREAVLKRVAGAGPGLELVVCDLSTSPYVDLAGAHMLAGLYDDLAAAKVRLELVEARSAVRDRLRAEGIEEKVGRVDRFRTLAAAVQEFVATRSSQAPRKEEAR
jgi:MFS superfamily sulfate permease-like transporter